ncbi:MAG: FG-GAP repeat protein [Leptospiraceae bacterium]|nr:FG-GAP repeat protein [Leptospiraceae bacterium]
MTVKRNPPGQVCMVHNSAGTISGAYVKNVNVQCASDTNWVQDAYLKASNAEGGDNFGTSVAISGSTIVVGAWSQDSNQTTITNADGQPGLPDKDDSSSSGAVYVFKAF